MLVDNGNVELLPYDIMECVATIHSLELWSVCLIGIDMNTHRPSSSEEPTKWDVESDNSFRGRMSSEIFEMNYDNTNGDPHTNEYELEVQGTIYIPYLVIAKHVK
ncbi:hypothetical protein Tco_0435178 [Tanacetum coccineum]